MHSQTTWTSRASAGRSTDTQGGHRAYTANAHRRYALRFSQRMHEGSTRCAASESGVGPGGSHKVRWAFALKASVQASLTLGYGYATDTGRWTWPAAISRRMMRSATRTCTWRCSRRSPTARCWPCGRCEPAFAWALLLAWVSRTVRLLKGGRPVGRLRDMAGGSAVRQESRPEMMGRPSTVGAI